MWNVSKAEGAGARATQAVIPDLDTGVRQDVRAEPADAFCGSDGADLESPARGVVGGEGAPAIFESEEAVVAERHTQEVRGPGLEGVSARAKRLTLHAPVRFPERGGDKVTHGGLVQRRAHVGTNAEGKRWTGTRQCSRAGSHCRPSAASPPAGRRSCPGGWSCRARVPGCQTPTSPIGPPTNRGAQARSWRAGAAERPRRLEKSVGWRRAHGRSASGTGTGPRQAGRGRRSAGCRCRHAWAEPCGHVGQGRFLQDW